MKDAFYNHQTLGLFWDDVMGLMFCNPLTIIPLVGPHSIVCSLVHTMEFIHWI